MTYYVSSGTLSPTHSLTHSYSFLSSNSCVTITAQSPLLFCCWWRSKDKRWCDFYGITDDAHHSSARPISSLAVTNGPVIPLHPDVCLKKLPFYEVLDVVIKPSNLRKTWCHNCIVSHIWHFSHWSQFVAWPCNLCTSPMPCCCLQLQHSPHNTCLCLVLFYVAIFIFFQLYPKHTSTFLSPFPQYSCLWCITSLPPLDNIWAMVIVWRMRGKIIRTVLCCIV